MTKSTRPLLIFLLCLFSADVLGHDISCIRRAVLGDDIDRPLMEVRDPWYVLAVNETAGYEVEGDVVVELKWDNSYWEHYSTAWAIEVTYTITTWDEDGDLETETNQSLEISFDPDTPFEDHVLKVYEGKLRGKIKVTDIDMGSLTAMPEGILLDIKVNSERYRRLDVEEDVPSLTVNNTPTADGYLEVGWDFITGAESYDLEWLFVDLGPDWEESPSTIDIDFRNATRVNLVTNAYKVPLQYPRGQLFFRVRAQGRLIGGTTSILPCAWSFDETVVTYEPWTDATSLGDYYNLTEGFATDMTWQYSAGYAENGMRKEAAGFYDPMLRPRQSVTVLQSTGTTILSENVYDGLGRQTLSVIPHPVEGDGIRFYEDQLRQSETHHYDYTDFDTTATYDDPVEFSNLTGASKYYSENNDLDGVNMDYVPDADGYVYSRTKLKNDGTGRAISISSLGSTLSEGSGHEVTITYSTPQQEELDRLFGNEAGLASKYQKVVTRDANGQSSVAYIDSKGRTVATALTGEAPKIDPEGDSSDANLRLLELANESSTEIVSDLTVFNNLMGTELKLIKTFTVTTPDSIRFEYSLEPEETCFNCAGVYHCEESTATFCRDCLYDLIIRVRDEYGDTLDLDIDYVFFDEDTLNNVSQVPEDLFLLGVPGTLEFNFDLGNLEPGTYTIEKILRLNEASIETYLDQFEAEQLDVDPEDPKVCYELGEFFGDCMDCYDECVSKWLVRDECGEFSWQWPLTTEVEGVDEYSWYSWPSAITSYDATLSAMEADIDGVTFTETGGVSAMDIANNLKDSLATCEHVCDPAVIAGSADICGDRLQRMKDQLSPGGAYFENIKYGEDPDTTEHWFDWLDANTLAGAPETYIWQRENGDTLLTWEEVRLYWNPAWADDLVIYHPEYCTWKYYCEHCEGEEEDLSPLPPRLVCSDYHNFYDYTQSQITMITDLTQFGALESEYLDMWDPLDISFQDDPADPAYMHIDVSTFSDDFWESMDASYQTVAVQYHDFLKNQLLYAFPKVATPGGLSDYVSIYFILDPSLHSIQGLSCGTAVASYYNSTYGITNAGTIALLESLYGCDSNPGALGSGSDQIQPLVFFAGYYNYLREYFAYWLLMDDCYQFDQLAYTSSLATSHTTPNICECEEDFYDSDVLGYIHDLGTEEVECDDENCDEGCDTDNTEAHNGFPILFPENDIFELMCAPVDDDEDGLIDQLQGTALYDMLVEQLPEDNMEACAAVCETEINAYLLENAACLDYLAADDAFAAMMAICECACSLELPMGSNTCTEEITYVYTPDGGSPTTYYFETFDEVLDVMGTSCPSFTHPGPELDFSEAPPAYSQSECQCERIQEYIDLYNEVHATDIADLSSFTSTDWDSFTSWANDLLSATDATLGAEVVPSSVDYDELVDLLIAEYPTYFSEDGNGDLVWDEELMDLWMAACPADGVESFGFLPGFLRCGDLGEYDWTPDPEDPCEKQLAQAESDFYYYQNLQIAERIQELQAALGTEIVFDCFAGIQDRESFTMKYTLSEFHYTLYFYDQADNLIKTIPPDGVYPLAVPDITTIDVGAEIANSSDGIVSSTAELTTVDVAAHRSDPASHPFVHTDFVIISEEPVEIHTLETYYKYNSLNQMISQETPDGGKTEFWYDPLGRIVMSQNERQRALDRFSYTFYDALGRSEEAGEARLKAEEDLSILTTVETSPPTGFEDYDLTSYTGAHKMTRHLGHTDFREMIETYFDRYEVVRSQYNEPFSETIDDLFGAAGQQNLRNRIASTFFYDQYEDENSDYRNATHYTYDIHGNVDHLVQDNPDLSILSQRYKHMEYTYDLISGLVYQVAYQEGEWDEYYHRYMYDDDARLTMVETSRDKVMWEKQAKYFYYAHGPLARVEIGQNQVYGADYAYTINGWLRGVNGDNLNETREIGKDGAQALSGNPNKQFARDAFGFSLYYYTDDYIPVGENNQWLTSFPTLSVDAQFDSFLNRSPDLYNGNIPRMTTAIAVDSFDIHLSGFKYDRLNRIRTSQLQHYVNDASPDLAQNDYTYFWSQIDTIQKYATTYTYDGNGNIKTLRRKNGAGERFDNFTYNYNYNAENKLLNNRLMHVDDSQSSTLGSTDLDDQSEGNYAYDGLGQLAEDDQDHIAHIEWSVTGKIRKIVRDQQSDEDEDPDLDEDIIEEYKDDLEFIYDAMGQRICKIAKPKDESGDVKPQTDWTYTYYVRDASGNVMATYERDINTSVGTYDYLDVLSLNEWNLYGSGRLGTDRTFQTVGRTYDATQANVTYDFDHQNESGLSVVSVEELLLTPTTTGSLPITSKAEQSLFLHIVSLKQYEISDHLGNVTVVITDRKVSIEDAGLTNYYTTEIINAQDYFPFGMIMPMRTEGSGYRYGFNGKELDPEGMGGGESTYDYGFRIYNPALAKFLSVDPLTSSYPWYTPYQFAGNKPIWCIDLDGLEEIEYTELFLNYGGNLVLEAISNEKILQEHLNAVTDPNNKKIKIIVRLHELSEDGHGGRTIELKKLMKKFGDVETSIGEKEKTLSSDKEELSILQQNGANDAEINNLQKKISDGEISIAAQQGTLDQYIKVLSSIGISPTDAKEIVEKNKTYSTIILVTMDVGLVIDANKMGDDQIQKLALAVEGFSHELWLHLEYRMSSGEYVSGDGNEEHKRGLGLKDKNLAQGGKHAKYNGALMMGRYPREAAQTGSDQKKLARASLRAAKKTLK